jgi:hypothetical protein
LREFAAAVRRSLPARSKVDLYRELHFAPAMAASDRSRKRTIGKTLSAKLALRDTR